MRIGLGGAGEVFRRRAHEEGLPPTAWEEEDLLPSMGLPTTCRSCPTPLRVA